MRGGVRSLRRRSLPFQRCAVVVTVVTFVSSCSHIDSDICRVVVVCRVLHRKRSPDIFAGLISGEGGHSAHDFLVVCPALRVVSFQ